MWIKLQWRIVTGILWGMETDKKAISNNQSLGGLWEMAQMLYRMVSRVVIAEQPRTQLGMVWCTGWDGEGLRRLALQHLRLKIRGMPGIKSPLICLLRTALVLSRTRALFNFIHSSGRGWNTAKKAVKPLRACKCVNRGIVLFSILLGSTNCSFWDSFITQREPAPGCPGEMTTFWGYTGGKASVWHLRHRQLWARKLILLKACVNCVFAIYGRRLRSLPRASGFNLLAERKALGRKS